MFSIQASAPKPPPVAVPTPTPTASVFRLTHYTAVTKVKAYVVRQLKGRRVKATCTRDDASQFTCRVRYVRRNKVRRITIEVYRAENGLNYQRL
jgi:hypothetical protein